MGTLQVGGGINHPAMGKNVLLRRRIHAHMNVGHLCQCDDGCSCQGWRYAAVLCSLRQGSQNKSGLARLALTDPFQGGGYFINRVGRAVFMAGHQLGTFLSNCKMITQPKCNRRTKQAQGQQPFEPASNHDGTGVPVALVDEDEFHASEWIQ